MGGGNLGRGAQEHKRFGRKALGCENGRGNGGGKGAAHRKTQLEKVTEGEAD